MGRAARLKKERQATTGITAETLKAKIADLAKQQEQAVANLNAMAGAKQAFEMLLADLASRKVEKPPLAPVDPPKVAQ